MTLRAARHLANLAPNVLYLRALISKSASPFVVVSPGDVSSGVNPCLVAVHENYQEFWHTFVAVGSGDLISLHMTSTDPPRQL